MTFTIVFSTFSACLANNEEVQHGAKLGMRRHIISPKRSSKPPSSNEASPSEHELAIETEKGGILASSAVTHQHEKRAYYGQGTYFNPGEGTPRRRTNIHRSRLTRHHCCPGACGWYASSSDHIAALNGQQYGDMGRKSPHCGSWIKITNRQTGASTRAKIQGKFGAFITALDDYNTHRSAIDACPGCGYGSLDLSPAAFDDLAPRSQGVVQIE